MQEDIKWKHVLEKEAETCDNWVFHQDILDHSIHGYIICNYVFS